MVSIMELLSVYLQTDIALVEVSKHAILCSGHSWTVTDVVQDVDPYKLFNAGLILQANSIGAFLTASGCLPQPQGPRYS
jgi:hypothetical protein